jgi:hypothetical protein
VQREEDLSTHEVKKMGSLDLSIATAGWSSHMKYLSMTFKDNLMKQVKKYGIQSHLRYEFIPEDNTLDGKVGVLVLKECLSLTVIILPLEQTHKTMLLNLILPSLNILIYGLGLVNNLHVYLQTIFLDSL